MVFRSPAAPDHVCKHLPCLLVVLRNHERQRFLLRLEVAELCAEVVVLGSELRNLVALGFN